MVTKERWDGVARECKRQGYTMYPVQREIPWGSSKWKPIAIPAVLASKSGGCAGAYVESTCLRTVGMMQTLSMYDIGALGRIREKCCVEGDALSNDERAVIRRAFQRFVRSVVLLRGEYTVDGTNRTDVDLLPWMLPPGARIHPFVVEWPGIRIAVYRESPVCDFLVYSDVGSFSYEDTGMLIAPYGKAAVVRRMIAEARWFAGSRKIKARK